MLEEVISKCGFIAHLCVQLFNGIMSLMNSQLLFIITSHNRSSHSVAFAMRQLNVCRTEVVMYVHLFDNQAEN